MHSRVRCSVLAMQDGVIAAGLASGVIEIWDPAKLAAGKGEAARVTKLDKHKGPVSACPWGSSLSCLAQRLQQSCCVWLIWQPKQPSMPRMAAVCTSMVCWFRMLAAAGAGPGV